MAGGGGEGMSDGSDIDGRDEVSNGGGGANGRRSWFMFGGLRRCLFRWQTMHRVMSRVRAQAPSVRISTGEDSSTTIPTPLSDQSKKKI